MKQLKIKGLLCFNGPILTDENDNFYAVAITDEFLKKYLAVVDELIILTRTEVVTEIKSV